MTTVFFPASFDPFTLGHLEIARHAFQKYIHKKEDRLVIVIGTNPDKLEGMFDKDTRQRLIEYSLERKWIPFTEITYATLATEKEVFARYKPEIIMRGWRNETDLDVERSLEERWRRVGAQITGWKFKVELYPASEEVKHVSSTDARKILEGAADPAELYNFLPKLQAILFNRFLGEHPAAGKDPARIIRLVNEELDRENLKRPFAVRPAAPAALMVGGG